MTRAIGVEPDCPFTPGMLKKVIYAGTHAASFAKAPQDLESLAERPISRERIRRWTTRIGDERVAEIERMAAAYGALPLPARRESPVDQVPQVACVQMDGGRIQIRAARGKASRAENPPGCWRESLVGCCLSMTSEEHAADPCPTIPRTFVDPVRMSELSRKIKGFSSEMDEAEESSEEPPDQREGRPRVLVRSVVATRAGVDQFGTRLVAAAHARGFHAARRKAFVADGAASNWGVHRRHFSHYTPVLDFTHAICYVYQAAMAGRTASAGWNDYCQWAQWLWEGKTDELVRAVAARAEELGPAGESDSESSPPRIVATTLGYLRNQRSRMKYAEYRRLGLPITSSHVESTIKQINRRVKGTEKFWHQGAEPLLNLAADYLSETHHLKRFWNNRPTTLKPLRCYHTAA